MAVNNAALESSASVSSFSKLNWDALKFTSFKHPMLNQYSFSLGIVNLSGLGTILAVSLVTLISEFCQEN